MCSVPSRNLYTLTLLEVGIYFFHYCLIGCDIVYYILNKNCDILCVHPK